MIVLLIWCSFTTDAHVMCLWCSCNPHVMIISSLCNVHVIFIWCSCDALMIFMWYSCDANVILMWSSAHNVMLMWCSYDASVRLKLCSCNVHVMILWCLWCANEMLIFVYILEENLIHMLKKISLWLQGSQTVAVNLAAVALSDDHSETCSVADCNQQLQQLRRYLVHSFRVETRAKMKSKMHLNTSCSLDEGKIFE